MYNVKNISLIVLLFVFSHFTFAQEKPEVVEPPEPFEFEFDFEHFHKMSEEDEKELLKNLNRNLKTELEVIKRVTKNKYFQFLRESQFKNMRMPFLVKKEKEAHEREQKIFEAEIKTEALAVKYETAKEGQKQSIKNDLRKELNKLFEIKETRRKQEVEQLEQELKKLKKSLVARQKNKNNIIERRLQELLDEDEYLDWD